MALPVRWSRPAIVATRSRSCWKAGVRCTASPLFSINDVARSRCSSARIQLFAAARLSLSGFSADFPHDCLCTSSQNDSAEEGQQSYTGTYNSYITIWILSRDEIGVFVYLRIPLAFNPIGWSSYNASSRDAIVLFDRSMLLGLEMYRGTVFFFLRDATNHDLTAWPAEKLPLYNESRDAMNNWRDYGRGGEIMTDARIMHSLCAIFCPELQFPNSFV